MKSSWWSSIDARISLTYSLSVTEKSKKGRALEKAVGFIQETILKSDPKLAGPNCSVEFNQVQIIGGVRHEIDVLVKTLLSTQFETTWIFECKNWNKPVGKKDISDFADKVKAVNANRGFLVARNLSRYADARIKQDSRLTFIPWTDEFESPLNNLETVDVSHDLFSRKAIITWQDARPNNPMELDWRKVKCRLNDQSVDFVSFIDGHTASLVEKDRRENAAKYRYEGKHWRELTHAIHFSPNEFQIDGLAVKQIKLAIIFWVAIRKQKITSKFELKNQGRVFSFEMIDDVEPQHAIEITVVQRL